MFKIPRRSVLKIAALAAAAAVTRPVLAADADRLTLWADGTARTRIVDFVAATTAEGRDDYVEPAAGVAVFDNDGTLWANSPCMSSSPSCLIA